MAAPAPRVILFLGDSITAGYGLDPDQAFPALIQEKIDAKVGISRSSTPGRAAIPAPAV